MKISDYRSEVDFRCSLMRCLSDARLKLKPRIRNLDLLFRKIIFFDRICRDLEKKPVTASLVYRSPSPGTRRRCPEICPIGHELVVGRKPQGSRGQSTLAIPEATALSRNHFRISRTGGMHVLFDDMLNADGSSKGSSNGTFVNSEILRQGQIPLKDGDIIFAGGVLFYFFDDLI